MLVDLDSMYSISMEIHPRMAWIYPIAENCQRGGVPECGVSAAWMRLPSPHGRVYGVPALWHRPANPRNASFCCCC
ncbi:hypothetical protein C7E14_11510 [Stenotrophomonas maltophilia]|nr:hypothetical protein C7E14_11510 [Stenotrophomonas maltophilia]